jgi:hypothetical protein
MFRQKRDHDQTDPHANKKKNKEGATEMSAAAYFL